MTRVCTVCTHVDVEEINKLLISGGAYRDLGRRYDLDKSALHRHAKAHIPGHLLKSADIKEYTAAEKLAGRLKDESDLVRELRDEARSEGDINTALRAVDRALKCIELCAKVQGLIQDQAINVSLQQTTVNIYDSPEWDVVGSLLARILAGYPELRSEVAGELIALERGSHGPP